MAELAKALSRLRRAHWQAAISVLDAVLQGQPTDARLRAWFRDHRQMGGRDRAQLTALVYGVLRDAMRLRRLAGGASAQRMLSIYALGRGLLDPTVLQAFSAAAAEGLPELIAAATAEACSEAERHNVPDPLWRRWCVQYGAVEAGALALALNREAPIDLRVNILKTGVDDAAAAFAQAGVEAQATPLSPWGLRLNRRVALQSMPVYREGWVEPQDEGSQLLALFVDARPGQRIADFCAGAGGKTLALGAAMDNEGELWALDIDAARLARLGVRVERAGLEMVQACALPDPDWLRAQHQSFDAVLVDAPCSGSGIWRRNPELRLRDIDFAGLARQQHEILASAATLVRPGGRLIYATCSLFAAENEEIVTAFACEQPSFSMVPRSDLWQSLGDGPFVRLLPQRHGTDGFFAAMLRRNEA